MTGVDKIKALFHHDKAHEEEVPASEAQAEAIHEAEKEYPHRSTSIRRQEEHARAEAIADERIEEREAEELTEPAEKWTPPTIVHGREPLETAVRKASLKRAGKMVPDAFEDGPKPGMPDLVGGTHIPESELPQRKDRMEHTATRPADPNDPKSMDGLPEPTTAGDDMAI
ncbi:hypothetical protein RQP46_003600 [Phenoliferia psychrophenolica]